MEMGMLWEVRKIILASQTNIFRDLCLSLFTCRGDSVVLATAAICLNIAEVQLSRCDNVNFSHARTTTLAKVPMDFKNTVILVISTCEKR